MNASYLNELNSEQRKPVENTEGPCMVLAGAGSGKTRVLTYRVAHLINNGVDPYNILCLTFTNKAAREMKERIAKMVGPGAAQSLWMGTFHSVFARILRMESEKIGYPSNFTIYDTQDSRSLIKTILKELKLDEKTYKPALVQNRISSAKNNLISAGSYRQNTTVQKDDAQSGKPRIVDVYEKYEKRCFQAGAMDFDDLLFKTNILLRDFPEVLAKYQDKFRYVLVDEFQDTNFSQSIILKRLAAKFENICVVGDDAQSIYAFRGANIQNILNFKKEYPDAKIFKLEQNYRSTQTIVEAANQVIQQNKEQLDKKVWTENIQGAPIHIVKNMTDNEEGMNIGRQIFESRNQQQLPYTSFAILYRTNAQSRAIEEALRKQGIPYKIYGGLSFYQRKEIKDILAYFRLALNPNDEEAAKRVINYPARGIGKTTLDKLVLTAANQEVSIWEVLLNPIKYGLAVNSATQNRLLGFAEMLKGFGVMATKKNAYDAGHEIAARSGLLKELYGDKSVEGVSRYENVQELLNGLKEFSDTVEARGEIPYLADFMSDVALLTDADQEDEEDNDKVSLMTIHAAKGLEFDVVFIGGMEENLFPSQLSVSSRTELEEERRLFYVALTRAEKEVFLSFSTTRYKWGNLIYCEPSRFLSEIPEQFVDMTMSPGELKTESRSSSHSGISQRNMGAPNSTTSFTPPPQRKLRKLENATPPPASTGTKTNISEGMTVSHSRFGEGTVVKVEGPSNDQKATIDFSQGGRKQLLLKFARLEVIEGNS